MASLGGNLSPVNRRRAILVSRTRHFRGDTGVVLKRRAEYLVSRGSIVVDYCSCTFLKDGSSVDFEDRLVSVLILLSVAHDGDNAGGRGGRYGNGACVLGEAVQFASMTDEGQAFEIGWSTHIVLPHDLSIGANGGLPCSIPGLAPEVSCTCN